MWQFGWTNRKNITKQTYSRQEKTSLTNSIKHILWSWILPSPIQTILSALVSHQIHRFMYWPYVNWFTAKNIINKWIVGVNIKYKTGHGLRVYRYSSPPVGNFTRPRRRSHLMCNHNYLINCIVHCFIWIINHFLLQGIFTLRRQD